MRLIDADAFEVIGGKVSEGYDVDSYLAGCKEILEMIDTSPTIEAVEVVRCRDCKYSVETSEQERELWGLSNDHMECCWFGSNVFANDFCSYGEREMDAEAEG